MSGRLIGVGVGPGDPELLTLKAVRALAEADVVAHFAKAGNASNARAIVAQHLRPGVEELPLLYPVTTEMPTSAAAYREAIRDFYDASAAAVARHLDAGRTVAVLSEGDPLFYGSYMHLHVRLAPRYRAEVIPGRHRDVGLLVAGRRADGAGRRRAVVLPATLPEAELARRLADAEAAVIMKVGRHLAKVRRALAAAGSSTRAIYVERGTMAAVGHHARSPTSATTWRPTSRWCWCRAGRRRAVSGRLAVLGLGPGSPQTLTPEAAAALDAAERSLATAPISTACLRAPDRRATAPTTARRRRARGGAGQAAAGRAGRGRLGRRSRRLRDGGGGLRGDRRRRRRLGARSMSSMVPGITAMLAVAARVGAPLGHDFCALSLSDNLKPWELVERRLGAAAGAGFVIALYNPISRARPWQLGRAFEVLRRHLPARRR